MRRHTVVTAVTAGAMAVTLTAGAGGPPAAAKDGDTPTATALATAAEGDGRAITLITGDRVVLTADGAVRSLLPAEGREGVAVQVGEIDGAVHVLPQDALPLIADGVVDRSLFDVTELARPEYDGLDGVPLLVSYDGDGSAARAALRAESEMALRHEFAVPAADALTAPAEEAGGVWEALTTPADDGDALRAAPGIRAVSLDRVVNSTLDTSVPQVGAPQAWAHGWDGTGVTLAVLDSGIASDHGDFADKIVATEDFSDAPGPRDLLGHGTHVASIAAGTGARSDGAYRGVAPGADLLDGKVLNDEGNGMESWIIAGMEWAVEQGADVVNLSLGGWPREGHDPMAEAIDRLSEESGALFVVSAGNSGPRPGSVLSPATADRALAVGSLDAAGAVATDSAVGPRSGDHALKPDLAAPGVDIGAAAAEGSTAEVIGTPVADGYVAISGTSQAAPHVAGAAALLRQAHPDWDGERIKNALIGSAFGLEDNAPVQQGTGRLDVARALDQTVTAESALNFGVVAPPLDDVKPVTRGLTYRNHGTADITLDLATTATAPEGGTVAEGLFTLATDRITVPAGSTVTVDVTADLTVTTGEPGSYGVYVTATGGDQVVRTAGTVELEVELFDVTFDVTDRHGDPAEQGTVSLIGWHHNQWLSLPIDAGIAQFELPADTYEVAYTGSVGPAFDLVAADIAFGPALTVTGDTTLALDFRDAGDLDFRAPEQGAAERGHTVGTRLTDGERTRGWSWSLGPVPEGIRTLGLGTAPTGWSMTTEVNSLHAGAEGRLYFGHRSVDGPFPTGLANRPEAAEMARVVATVGTPSRPGRTGRVTAQAGDSIVPETSVELPGVVEFWLQGDLSWQRHLLQNDYELGVPLSHQYSPARLYRPGEEWEDTMNVGVFGPSFHDGYAFVREGNELRASLFLFSDRAANRGFVRLSESEWSVHRDGDLLDNGEGDLRGLTLVLPDGEARYRVVSTARRSADTHSPDQVTTEVSVDYTFTSATTAAAVGVAGPYAVRFTPELAPDTTAPGGESLTVPVAVQGGAYTALSIEVSHDLGDSWEQQELAPDDKQFEIANPPAGGSISLRATVEGEDGDRTVQTILDAYRTR